MIPLIILALMAKSAYDSQRIDTLEKRNHND